MKTSVVLLILLTLMVYSCEKANLPLPNVHDAKPIFTFSNVIVNEGDHKFIEVTVNLKGKHTNSILIPYSTYSDSAEPFIDYGPIDGVLAFIGTDSTETQSIFIEILDDDIFENDEDFEIHFEIDSTVIATKTNLNITIQDNDIEYTDNDYPGYVTLRNKEGWNLIWSDEFSENELNLDNWTQADKGNWYNNELQYYSPNNTAIENGLLTITALPENKSGHNYTSSRMWTKHKIYFQYGRIDIRAKLPFSQGLWPALWMMGENIDLVGWAECGEIDIMELKGSEPNTVSSTIHFKDPAGNHKYPPSKKHKLHNGDYSDKFHVFSMFWNEYRIEFFVDDQRYSTIFHNNFSHFNDDNPFKKEFYILMNVAVGGNFDGNPNATTVWPQKMDVDYVRVYQEK